MSDDEPEYEVETIQRAKVEVDKRGKKTWKYYVKWKGYSQEENSWEPVQSFRGSEHFVETFWQRVRCERDHTQMKLFKPNEEILPVGPPGRNKGKNKNVSIPAKDETRKSPRRPAKLKEACSKSEVRSIIDEDANEAPTGRSFRKRPSSAARLEENTPSKKRKRGHLTASESEDSDEEVVDSASAAPTSNRRASTTHARPIVQKPVVGARSARSSASPAKRTRGRGTVHDYRKHHVDPSVEILDLVSDDDEPVATLAKKAKSSPAHEASPSLKVDDSNGIVVARRPRAVKLPTREANNVVPAEGGSSLTVKSPVTRKLTTPSGDSASPSTSRVNGARIASSRHKVSGSRAGPGRSSAGVIGGSTSVLTVKKGGSPQIIRKSTAISRTGKARRAPSVEEPDPMVIDEALEDATLPPLSKEDMDSLTNLTMAAAVPTGSFPDYVGVSDRDAEGEVEPESAGQSQFSLGGNLPANMEEVVDITGGDNAREKSVESSPKEPEAPRATKQAIINRPDAAISSSNLDKNSSFAAWKTITIFDNISSASFRRPTDPPATSSESTSLVFSVPVSPSVRVSVVLKDIQAPVSSVRKRLDEITAQEQTGPPGKFYKGQTALKLLDAFGCDGSCARVDLESGANDTQQKDFERFRTHLEDDGLFVVVIGHATLAFCSSGHNDITTKLGASPNLIGLGDNILVSEVDIMNDSAYLEAILDAREVSW